MLIKNASILYGQNLEYYPKINLRIKDGLITKVARQLGPAKDDKVYDCQGLLVVPGFVNSHTHIGDSLAKDMGLSMRVDQLVDPIHGIKRKILKNSTSRTIKKFIQKSANLMLSKGITTFVDFREGGIAGVNNAKKALLDTPIRSIILGRIENYNTPQEIRKNSPLLESKSRELNKLFRAADGIGVSGVNETSNSVLEAYSQCPKIRAIHCAETKDSYKRSLEISGVSEPKRALLLRPRFLVHMTYATKSDVASVSSKGVGIVVCPRANATLAEGIPNVQMMKNAGCKIALGTDNVMINSPDMFKEMDFVWKSAMGVSKSFVDVTEVLKMATVNGGKVIREPRIGVIQENAFADLVFFDKDSLEIDPVNHPAASVVHRATESSIKSVMVGGKVVNGKI